MFHRCVHVTVLYVKILDFDLMYSIQRDNSNNNIHTKLELNKAMTVQFSSVSLGLNYSMYCTVQYCNFLLKSL